MNRFPSLSTLVAVLMLGVLPALAETRSTVGPPLTPEGEVFPIGCFPGPPAEANTLSNWRSIRDANFTVACPIYRYDQPANLIMLDHCQDLGLKAVVNVKLIPATADSPLPGDWRKQVEQTVATYADHKALFGYMLKDEPSADQFGQIRDVVAEFATRDPSHCTCVNLFPVYATSEQLGTSTYGEHLERFMGTVNPDFLCYDHYTFMKNGTDRPDFFDNLEHAREACRKHDKRCWTVILSGWHEHFREPTEAELRWQVYGALAYGIKGIFYFTYWPVNDGYAAIVDYAGKPQRLYEPVRRLNSEILQLGRTLLRLESTNVFHTGATIPQGCRRLPEGLPLSVPQDLPLVVGFFRDKSEGRYVMVVNRNCEQSASAELRFSRDVEAVSRISELNGLASAIMLDKGRATMDLPPGSGVLLRLDPEDHDSPSPRRNTSAAWGNAVYVNLDIGDSTPYLGKSVTLLDITADVATVSVSGETRKLTMARLTLPTVINGVHVFVADTRPVASLTTDDKYPLVHAALTGDALLCLSDPARPLLDTERFAFPVSRDDGFRWSMAENSHMFAYRRPQRSHEGIDIDLTAARGREIHALVAIEDGTVRWVEYGRPPEACLLLESASQTGLYYIYQHLNRDKVFVQPGQSVKRGDRLAYIWGDWRWGHLHFSVVGDEGQPDYAGRYRYVLNCFPQLAELWHGSLAIKTPVCTSGNFRLANQYWEDGNTQRLSAWSDVLGYGWQLGDWCAAGKVEHSLADEGGKPFQSARLSKIMHTQTRQPARNPHDWFDFEVAVENGTYGVRAEVGDYYAETWQRVEFERIDVGTFELSRGELQWTDEKRVAVSDDRLTIRIRLRGEHTPSGLRTLRFEKIP